MSTATQEDLAKLILRLAIGIFILLHGIAKVINGVGAIEGMMVARGLPAFLAWAVYVGEVLAPLMLILGLYTRLGALLIAANMVVAVTLAHSGQLMQLSGSGGWRLELQGLFLFGSIAIALLGAGRFSVGGKGGSWN